jgi:hypothetical protein
MLWLGLANSICAAARVHCCTAALLHCCTAALLHCCTAALLHCCTAEILHCLTAALQHYRLDARLCHTAQDFVTASYSAEAWTITLLLKDVTSRAAVSQPQCR